MVSLTRRPLSSPLPDVPGEPTKLRVVDSTKSSITLGWDAPVYDGGNAISHYDVEMMNTMDREWITISTKGEVQTCEFVVGHLKPAVWYLFRVFAVNSKGRSEDIRMYSPIQAKDILG